jgi:hypothetical protein
MSNQHANPFSNFPMWLDGDQKLVPPRLELEALLNGNEMGAWESIYQGSERRCCEVRKVVKAHRYDLGGSTRTLKR